MPNGQAEQVQFKSPKTGIVKALDREDWDEALSRGYKPVDHRVMYSPEGKRGLVPNAELRDYAQRGYQTTPETQFEREHPTEKPAFGFTPANLYEEGKRGIRDLAGGAYEAGKDVLFPQGNTEGERLSFLAHKYVLDPADAEREKARTAPTAAESMGHSAASAIPLVGPWAASLGEQAGTGDVGGAMARGGSQIGTAEHATPILKAAKVGTGMARDAVRDSRKPVVGGDTTPKNAGVDQQTVERQSGSIRSAATPSPGSESVSILPEPMPAATSGKTGAMWSIPREQLQSAAMRGTPGAGDVLQSTGRTILYEPRGAVGAGRGAIRFTPDGAPIGEAFKSIRESAAPALRPEVQGLMRSRAMDVPEWIAGERSYEMQKAQDILRNPAASEEELAVAQARLSAD
jgi:hypothetical protein